MISFIVGERIRFADDLPYWWEVRAADDRWAIVVRQAPFRAKGILWYSIVDTKEQIRGACNLIGQGWGDGTYSVSECEGMLRALQRNLMSPDVLGLAVVERFEDGRPRTWLADDEPMIEISHRNRVTITGIQRANGREG